MKIIVKIFFIISIMSYLLPFVITLNEDMSVYSTYLNVALAVLIAFLVVGSIIGIKRGSIKREDYSKYFPMLGIVILICLASITNPYWSYTHWFFDDSPYTDWTRTYVWMYGFPFYCLQGIILIGYDIFIVQQIKKISAISTSKELNSIEKDGRLRSLKKDIIRVSFIAAFYFLLTRLLMFVGF